MTQELRLRRPDDWHLHLRDGTALRAVLPFTAARFARAIVMPNLNPPVTTTAMALAYRERILAALPPAIAAINGVCSAGLATTVLPAASAAATWPRKIASGKFHGLIQMKTPRPR